MSKNQRLIELDDTNTWSVTTEAFLSKIHQSSDLLRQDRQHEARELLERAFESRVDDPFGQATLALVYFKLGIYPRAAAIYEKLVHEHPNETTLRLNLGLVYLKTGQTEKAVRELEAVLKLNPNYQKANGYLALAYQRLGEFKEARKCFAKAGAKHLADRMNQFMDSGNDGVKIALPADTGKRLPTAANVDNHLDNNDLTSRLASFLKEAASSKESPTTGTLQNYQKPLSVASIKKRTNLLEPSEDSFRLYENGFLIIDTHDGRLLTRLQGLHLVSGPELTHRPAKRNYRGKDTNELFGESDNPICIVEGTSQLGFCSGQSQFIPIRLDGEVTYFCEPFLFAMDGQLKYENGRMPGEGGMLVHLSGTGEVVLKTPSNIHCLEVTPDNSVTIPKQDLVGWFGHLLPKPVVKSPLGKGLDALEMIGEGSLLVCPP